MPSHAAWAADAPDGVASAAQSIAQTGVLGALVVLLGAFAYRAYRREVDRADRLEAENSRLRDGIETRVVPLVERALAVIESARVDRRGDRHSDRHSGAVTDTGR